MPNLLESDVGLHFNNYRPGQDIYIYECGYEVCKPTKPLEYIPINYYLIHYCVEGEGYLKVNGVEKHILEGDIFLIPPKTENMYYPVKENPWAYVWIGIEGNLAKKYLEDSGLTKENFVLSYGKDDLIFRCFKEVYNSCATHNYLMAMSYLYCFFGTVIQRENSNILPLSSGEGYYKKIIEYINSNYFNDISIQDIASQLSIDRTYIFKLFKRYLKVSPQQYLLNYRIDKACELLEKSRLDVTQISCAVGFNSPNYFTKQFSAKMGITPLKYRKSYYQDSIY